MILENKSLSAQLALAMCVIFATGTAAVAQDVKTNYMPGTNFSKYKTYKWVVIEGAHMPDQIMDQQIKLAIDTQMAAKGFTKADGDTGLDLGYQISVANQTQWSTYGTGGPRWGWGGGMVTTTSSTYQVGTLDLDMYDPATRQLVWRGTATKTVNPSDNPEKNQKNLNKAMEKLLKKFPPPAQDIC